MTIDTRDLSRPTALSLLLVLAGYYAGSIVGIQLGLRPSGIGATWPPTAILLAALLLSPPRYWWVYLLGVIPAHLHVVGSFQFPEVPFVVRFCQVGTNILLAVLAAFALRSLISAPPKLGNLRNMGVFILVAVVATAFASAVGVWLFLLTGWAADFWFVWRQRVLANLFTIVTIPPVIVLAFAGQFLGAHATRRSYLELALIAVGVLVVGIPVFGLESPGPSNLPALMLAPLPFLMWAAVRVGVGGTGLTLLTVAGIAVADALIGRGPFINRAPDVNVLSLQIFLTAISIPTLLLAALVEERRQEAESLKQTSKKAELALAERSLQLELAGKAALVGTFAYDVATERMQISAGYAAIHGFPEGTSEIAYRQWQLGVHPEDLERWEELRSLTFSDQRREYGWEYRVVRPEGEVRWIEARSFVSYGSNCCAQRVVGVDIDITNRKRAEEHQNTLLAELDHRVKNVLATVGAIIVQTPKANSSLADYVAGLGDRIKSLARTHELLSHSRWHGVSLEEIIQRELAPYLADNAEIGGPYVTLKAEAAPALGMVLHELATNAAKYGAFSKPGGRLVLRWRWLGNGSPGRLIIEWREFGGLPHQEPSQPGYGTSIIREVIPFELGGTSDLEFASGGLRCRLEIPADWARGSDREESQRP